MSDQHDELSPLPGSELFAKRIERSRFLRWAANGVFLRIAAGSAVGYRFFFMNPELARATGGCCSYACCGPSPCCGTGCCSKNCCSSTNPSECANCSYDYGDYPSSACWTCFYSNYSVVCCDCQASGCGSYNRCICEKAVHSPTANKTLVGMRTETSANAVPVTGADVFTAPVP